MPSYPGDLVVKEDKAAVADAVRRNSRGPAMSGDLPVRLAHQPTEPVALTVAGLRGLGDAAVLLLLKDNSEEAKLKRQIAQATKMQAVGQLAGGVAHDFNNLLTVILNSLDVIAARTVGNDNIASPLKAAIRACDRGALLTRQLLTFGRGQNLLSQPTHLSELIRKSADLFERACADQVSLRFELSDHLPPVLVDRAQLEAAILNLVCNSRDALSGSGNIVVRTSTGLVNNPLQPDSEPSLHVCAEVSDDGPGIPVELQAKVFDPFFTTKEVGKGSGLGLSQVFGLATQSGGFVQLASNPGQGATFRIWLPAGMEKDDGEASQDPVR